MKMCSNGHSENVMEGADLLLGLTKCRIDDKPDRQDRPIQEKEKKVFNEEDNSYDHSSSSSFQRRCDGIERNLNKNWKQMDIQDCCGGDNGDLVLNGYHFFGYGIDINVMNTVTKLGGKFHPFIKGDSLKRSNVSKKLFFLSNVSDLRNVEYLLACVLGVPMLYYEWIYALERKCNEFRSLGVVERSENDQPTVFDTNLYRAYR